VTNAAARIFSYNWPTYGAVSAGALAAIVVARALAPAWASLVTGGAVLAVAWAFASLVVSHWIYDRSELHGGAWLPALLPPRTSRWAAIDAGLDAEVDLACMPGTCVAWLDVFDPRIMRAPSIGRPRRQTPRTVPATPAAVEALPLADRTCDALVVPFTAHEIRDRAARERFFAETARALVPGGRLVVVEHVRDLANFLAFGPGNWHFQPRGEFLRVATLAGLRLADERRITPWVHAFAFEKSGGAS
jgi:SAM-dependent methyltransferase